MHIGINSKKFDITSEIKTKEISEKFSNYLKKGDIVYLLGEIGTGKTTFVKYFINKFQTDEQLKLTEVTSPTFNLLNEYETKHFTIKHYDLFRIKNSLEIKDLDIFDVKSQTITFIEWPQILENKAKVKSIDLLFAYENELKNRTVQIKGLN